jgi:GTP-binding protein
MGEVASGHLARVALKGIAQEKRVWLQDRKKVYPGEGFAATVVSQLLMMNINSAIFDRSAPDLDSCPNDTLPEFAFIGRSNVGKSSLLNTLAGRQELARVSPTPGFTKLINLFTINQCWRLVDLPGYGFAQVARKDSSRFNQAVAHYLLQRTNLGCVFSLIEAGLPPQAMDLEFVEWLAGNAVPFVLVFTKADKVAAATTQKHMEAFTNHISALFEPPPATVICSAKTGLGRQELLGVIDEVMLAIQAEAEPAAGSTEGMPTPSAKLRLQKSPKRRPDRKRCW